MAETQNQAKSEKLTKRIVIKCIKESKRSSGVSSFMAKTLFCNGFICSIPDTVPGYSEIEEGAEYDITYTRNGIYSNVHSIKPVEDAELGKLGNPSMPAVSADSADSAVHDVSVKEIEELFPDILPSNGMETTKAEGGAGDVDVNVNGSNGNHTEDLKLLIDGVRTLTTKLLDMLERIALQTTQATQSSQGKV